MNPVQGAGSAAQNVQNGIDEAAKQAAELFQKIMNTMNTGMTTNFIGEMMEAMSQDDSK